MSNGGAKWQFFQFEDASGNTYASCKLYHYAAGTSTDKDIWSDEGKVTACAQPLVGDSRGITTFYADGDYKFVLKDSSDNTLYTWDNVNITSDLATMWEGNHGTAYPTAAAANIWQLFAKHTAGNVLQEVGINNGSAFIPLINTEKDTRYAADSGAADAYVVTLSPAPSQYLAGMVVIMKATNANTGASTINVNSLGLKNITKDGATALTAGDILAAEIVTMIYDGTQFQLQTALRGDGTVNTNLNADKVDGYHYSDLSGSRVVAYRNAVQSIPDTTVTKIQFNTEDFDTGNEFDSTTNYRFTAIAAGYYMVSAQATFVANATGLRGLYIKKNTSTLFSDLIDAQTTATTLVASGIIYLAINDYVEAHVQQTSTGALNLSASNRETSISIFKLS